MSGASNIGSDGNVGDSYEPEWLSDPEDPRHPDYVDRDLYRRESRKADQEGKPDDGPVLIGEVVNEMLRDMDQRLRTKKKSSADPDESVSR